MSGVLLYVIGPSGSGKDSLMRFARETLATSSSVVFAHRYITRPHDAGGENHVALSDAEFQSRVEHKLLSLHWNSHGLRYGIGCEVNHWLAKGLTVILNGSRAYLPQASRQYSELVPVLIEVSQSVLRERLLSRGREEAGEIESRLMRACEFDSLHHSKLLRFNNDAVLESTGPSFVELIRRQEKVAACD